MESPVLARKQRRCASDTDVVPNHHDVRETGVMEIDDGLYSRQRYVLGDTAMKRIARSKVFVSGMGGLGVELAKNLILAGVGALTIHETRWASHIDLASQFYVKEADLGKNRATVSVPSLAELNRYVHVDALTEPLSADNLSILDLFHCVILTETPLSLQQSINEYCRSRGIHFLSADVRGVFAWAFNDFGQEFEISDKNGEEPSVSRIGNITKGCPAIVTCLEHGNHLLETGDLVSFDEIQGMDALNGTNHRITVISPMAFSIEYDTSCLPPYLRGGVATQIKTKEHTNFLSLRDSLAMPEFNDFSKPEQPMIVHIGMQALDLFWAEESHFPRPWDEADCIKVLELARQINSTAHQAYKLDSLDENVLKCMSFTAQGTLAPLTSFMGGVVAQEALKALTGKFTPLHQWFCFNSMEVVPMDSMEPIDFRARGDRKDGQRICIGEDVCQRLEKLRVFMVGAGAIGCEMLKLFALMNVSADPCGSITVADNDVVEKSNLNRQFLFRPSDIRKPKAQTACQAAQHMNPTLHLDPRLDKVHEDTLNVFDDAFFTQQDIVVNALDNVATRLFMDMRCVANQRPLLESGTLGTKGHVQVILPFLTESYATQRDPPEMDIPFCTLKSFPNAIEHTIQWARDKFHSLFFAKVVDTRNFMENPKFIDDLRAQSGPKLLTLRNVNKMLSTRPRSFEDCLALARIKFEKHYHNNILQLLHCFPRDMTTTDGTPFWAPPKQPPSPITFDLQDPLHIAYLENMASIYADIFGLSHKRVTEVNLEEVLLNVDLPEYVADDSKKIATSDEPPKTKIEGYNPREFEDMAAKVLALKEDMKGIKIVPIEFEKDNDDNHHIGWITTASNLRGRNYGIQEADHLKTKRIAGKIIPAIATTTAAVAGLVTVEFIKIVMALPLERFHNTFLNLALPVFVLGEPRPAERFRIHDDLSITVWDRWEMQGGPGCTLSQFIEYFKETYKLKVNGVFHDKAMIYMPMFSGHQKRLQQRMSKLLKVAPDARYADLVVTFTDMQDVDVTGPVVRYFLR